MKFTAYDNGNTHTCIHFENWNHFYITEAEMDKVIQGKFTLIYDYNIMECTHDMLILYENPLNYGGTCTTREMKVKSLLVYCNTRQMFTRIRENTKRVGVYKEITMDTDSFSSRRSMKNLEQLGFCQILKHPNFKGKESLFYAVKHKIGLKTYLDPNRVTETGFDRMNWRMNHRYEYRERHVSHIIALREQLSRMLQQGHTICNDWPNTPDFYFFGGGYNGGIIFHGPRDGYGSGSAPTFAVCLNPTHGWSVHT